jgi:large subunit ribosomal protein L18
MLEHQAKLQKRKAHVRKNVTGSADKPRLTVFRSNTHIYAQLIDDVSSKTLVSASDVAIKAGKPVEKAAEVGAKIAELAMKKGIETVIFDRNGRQFHGRVKALADAARNAGLKF